jgi:hypothetical protein
VSAFYSIASVSDAPGPDSVARYAASRSIALLLVVLVAFVLRHRASVLALACCISLVQFFDGWIGFLAGDPTKTLGPFVFGIINAFLAYVLWKEPREGTWLTR